MPAIMNHTSNAIKVSEIRFNPVVVSSETAITLTIAECLIKEISNPVKGGRIKGIDCGTMM
jgi:hypothetical protein